METYTDETGQQHELKMKLSYRMTSIWAYCECGFDEGFNVADLGGVQNTKNQARAEHAEFFQAGA
jgi:hypothetical protein